MEKTVLITTHKNETFWSKLDENADTDSAKIWNLDFGKIRFPEKYEIGTSQLRKNTKSAPQNLKLNCDLEFSIQKSIFQNPKSISPIPLESCFET